MEGAVPQPADLVVGLGGSVGLPGMSRVSLEAMGPEDAPITGVLKGRDTDLSLALTFPPFQIRM